MRKRSFFQLKPPFARHFHPVWVGRKVGRRVGCRVGRALCLSLAAAILVACTTPPTVDPRPAQIPPKMAQGSWQAAQWSDLPAWQADDLHLAWSGWLASCKAIGKRAPWQAVCAAAGKVDALDNQALRAYFEQHFQPYRLLNDDGSQSGTITGYYEPLLRGSRQRQGVYQTPLHRLPESWRGRKNLPTRAQIKAGNLLKGQELIYVDDPVEAAFLQIQGSGRIVLPDGSMMRVGFAGTNEQPFQSIGRWLLDKGELKPSQATMQGIKAWAKANPQRVEEMLSANPRYVFFKEMPMNGDEGPLGALGVPLTHERSLAIDPRSIPLGAPVYLATTRPLSNQALQRLMFAQDTGSAIKGTVRADFFWGYGNAAGEIAGRMKQQGQMWVLWPR